MQKILFSVLCLMVSLVGTSFAEPTTDDPVRYMADTQNYVDAINHKIATNTLEASNLLLFNQLNKLYPHEFASLARIQYFMDNGKAICIANKLKTPERAAKYIFSDPVNVHLSHRLYQHQNMHAIPPEVLNEEGEIKSLNLLFSVLPAQTILLPFQRSFGEMLDKQISLLPANNKVIYRGGDLHDNEIDMFIKQRADFLLTYPTTIYANDRALQSISMHSYGIENNPKYTISRIMCANTPATQIHIQKVNQALHILYSEPDLLNTHLKWLPESDRDKITSYYQQVIQAVVTEPTI